MITILQSGNLTQGLKNRSIGTTEAKLSIQVKIVIPARKLLNNQAQIDTTTINRKTDKRPLTETGN